MLDQLMALTEPRNPLSLLPSVVPIDQLAQMHGQLHMQWYDQLAVASNTTETKTRKAKVIENLQSYIVVYVFIEQVQVPF